MGGTENHCYMTRCWEKELIYGSKSQGLEV